MPISARGYSYLLLWFGFIAVCSNLTPYFANDFRYFLIQGTTDSVVSLSDILISQYRHYFEWGGRTVAHIIAQTLLYIDKPISSVIQAFCYIILILFIYYNAYGIRPQLKLRFVPLFVISAMLFLQLRVFGEVVFNVVSSANYLYTTTIVLIFLLPYRISMRSEISLNIIILWPMMAILGLLSGWTNENTAAAVASVLGIYLLYRLYTRELRIWQCIGYLFFLIGFALLVFAPGNNARFESMTVHGFDYIKHIFATTKIFFFSLLCCALLVISTIYVFYRVRSRLLQYANLPMYYGGVFFAALGFLSLFLMIFSPNFPARSATPFTIFTTVALIAWSDLLIRRYGTILPPKLCRLLIIIIGILMLAISINIVWALSILNNDMKIRKAEIYTQLEAKQNELVVSPLSINTYKYIFVADVRSSPAYWTNNILRQYYKVHTIERKCDYPKSKIKYDFIFFTSKSDLATCTYPNIDRQKEIDKLDSMPTFSDVPEKYRAPEIDIFNIHFGTAHPYN